MCNFALIYSFWHTRSFAVSQLGFVVRDIRLSFRFERILSFGLYWYSFLLLGHAPRRTQLLVASILKYRNNRDTFNVLEKNTNSLRPHFREKHAIMRMIDSHLLMNFTLFNHHQMRFHFEPEIHCWGYNHWVELYLFGSRSWRDPKWPKCRFPHDIQHDGDLASWSLELYYLISLLAVNLWLQDHPSQSHSLF